uniref:Uncharacterized protein n=1 Tax=Coccidioides posadasii RMSCC 3488 TaxID=454284 RepID=A0A0J6FMU0_COCPO|nr:hypothetical protein CPAG_07991 [Coccidioides posadasii RMSCC 3488]
MRPLNSNIPAFNLTISTLLRQPSYLLPNYTIPTLLDLPHDLGPHLLPPSSTATHPRPPPTIPTSPRLHALRNRPIPPPSISPHKPRTGILIRLQNTSGQQTQTQTHLRPPKPTHARIPPFTTCASPRLPAPPPPPTTPRVSHKTPLKKPFSFPAVLKYLMARNVVESLRRSLWWEIAWAQMC